jgi:hypothetical protein
MLTVACVFVRGHVPFTVEYVAKLRAMTAKHLARPHRFVCLTDRPDWMPDGVEPIEVPPVPAKVFAWWAKVSLFNPSFDLGDRTLYLDLDVVIVDALDPIVDFPAPFALIPDAGTFKPKTSHAVVKRFNSSVMVFDQGAGLKLAGCDVRKASQRLWGDQDLIGEQLPDLATMPLEWFPRLSALKEHPPTPPAKVVLAKVPKNHVAADLYPWFGHAWRAA